MKFWVGVTDKNWFDYLANIKPDEVNFWKPGGQGFRVLEIGELFLFKLHSPINKIVGGGFFIRAEQLPLSLAWDAFGNKNGAENYFTLRNIINQYRKLEEADPTIGCIILNEPFFFPEDQWIDVPDSFTKNIVIGKSYDTTEYEGKRLWDSVMERLNSWGTKIVSEPENDYRKE